MVPIVPQRFEVRFGKNLFVVQQLATPHGKTGDEQMIVVDLTLFGVRFLKTLDFEIDQDPTVLRVISHLVVLRIGVQRRDHLRAHVVHAPA